LEELLGFNGSALRLERGSELRLFSFSEPGNSGGRDPIAGAAEVPPGNNGLENTHADSSKAKVDGLIPDRLRDRDAGGMLSKSPGFSVSSSVSLGIDAPRERLGALIGVVTRSAGSSNRSALSTIKTLSSGSSLVHSEKSDERERCERQRVSTEARFSVSSIFCACPAGEGSRSGLSSAKEKHPPAKDGCPLRDPNGLWNPFPGEMSDDCRERGDVTTSGEGGGCGLGSGVEKTPVSEDFLKPFREGDDACLVKLGDRGVPDSFGSLASVDVNAAGFAPGPASEEGKSSTEPALGDALGLSPLVGLCSFGSDAVQTIAVPVSAETSVALGASSAGGFAGLLALSTVFG
jgi:hypothetical protein